MNSNTILFTLTCNHSRVTPAFFTFCQVEGTKCNLNIVDDCLCLYNKDMNSLMIRNDYSDSLCISYVFVYTLVY
jgi:hypothetical protein